VNGWLIDTNVLSELHRPKPHVSVLRFLSSQPNNLLHVSVVTFAEIRFGIELLKDSARRMELYEWLDNDLRPRFENRVLEINEDIMLTWKQLAHEGRKAGYTFAQPDLLIAATALHHGLTIVSRDTSEFLRVNVPVFNPWTLA
jgi:predicted nucleic acid-binding protein